jgi:hypothetical protein
VKKREIRNKMLHRRIGSGPLWWSPEPYKIPWFLTTGKRLWMRHLCCPSPSESLWEWTTLYTHSPVSFWITHQLWIWQKPKLRVSFSSETVITQQQWIFSEPG